MADEPSVEIIRYRGVSRLGRLVQTRFAAACRKSGLRVLESDAYVGSCDWLLFWGVGADGRAHVRDRHLAAGGRVFHFDYGFFHGEDRKLVFRVAMDGDYVTPYLGQTPEAPNRLKAFGVVLRDTYNPDGHIVLAGVGPKMHAYTCPDGWEAETLCRLRTEYPDRRIVYRPKPNRVGVLLPCETDSTSTIEHVLLGASLAVCYHSNVAVDAVLAGVPVDVVEGPAAWLGPGRKTEAERAGFLCRLALWQYTTNEVEPALRFMRQMDKETPRCA